MVAGLSAVLLGRGKRLDRAIVRRYGVVGVPKAPPHLEHLEHTAPTTDPPLQQGRLHRQTFAVYRLAGPRPRLASSLHAAGARKWKGGE